MGVEDANIQLNFGNGSGLLRAAAYAAGSSFAAGIFLPRPSKTVEQFVKNGAGMLGIGLAAGYFLSQKNGKADLFSTLVVGALGALNIWGVAFVAIETRNLAAALTTIEPEEKQAEKIDYAEPDSQNSPRDPSSNSSRADSPEILGVDPGYVENSKIKSPQPVFKHSPALIKKPERTAGVASSQDLVAASGRITREKEFFRKDTKAELEAKQEKVRGIHQKNHGLKSASHLDRLDREGFGARVRGNASN